MQQFLKISQLSSSSRSLILKYLTALGFFPSPYKRVESLRFSRSKTLTLSLNNSFSFFVLSAILPTKLFISLLSAKSCFSLIYSKELSVRELSPISCPSSLSSLTISAIKRGLFFIAFLNLF